MPRPQKNTAMREFFATYGIDDDVIAAGVSGGADSLALALRLQAAGKKVVALTVDHGLRPQSRQEAEYVGQVMHQAGIEHHILTWAGAKPTRGIEAAARQKRYELLEQWCLSHGVKTLAVGHHRRDQAETFLLRLLRGSGVDGLSCMLPVSARGGVRLIRPQLGDDPDRLRAYLQERNIRWVEDESNGCEDFWRVKIRHFLPELEQKIGLSEQRLAETAAVLARTRAYLEEQTEREIQNNVSFFESCVAAVSLQAVQKLHAEMAYRLFGRLIRNVGKQTYAPEAAEILRLLGRLQADDFKGCTLGGCEIFVAQKKLWLVPEATDGAVLSKQEWQKCLRNLPQYAKAKLPYKVRRAIFRHLAKDDNGNEK